MAKHEEGEFDVIIRKHQITMEPRRVDDNSPMPNGAPAMSHWVCTLHAEGGKPLEVTCSLGAGYGEAEPSTPLVLALLSEDVRSYRCCDGFGTWARRLGLDVFGDEDAHHIGKWNAAYNEIARISAGFDALLGPEVTIGLAGEDLRAMPGADYAHRPAPSFHG